MPARHAACVIVFSALCAPAAADILDAAQSECRRWSTLRCGGMFLMADTPELWPEPFRGTDGTMTLGTFFREFQRLDETEIARIMALNGWSERDLDTVIDATDARLYAHDGFHPRDIADQDVAHWSYAAPECEAQIVHAVDNGVRCVRMTREIAMIFAPTVAGMIANASWMTPEEFIARNDMPPGSTADTELVLDRWYLVAE